jgi:hypothetical protein
VGNLVGDNLRRFGLWCCDRAVQAELTKELGKSYGEEIATTEKAYVQLQRNTTEVKPCRVLLV